MITLAYIAVTGVTFIDAVLIASALIAALIAIGKFLIMGYKAIKVIDLIYHEVIPNGGSSLRDAVDKLDMRYESDHTLLLSLDARVQRNTEMITQVLLDEK